MNRLRFVVFSIIALFPLVAVSDEAEWGNLTGRFLYDGKPPRMESFRVTKDSAAFGNTMNDESLMVNANNGGIANLVVYLLPDDDGELAVHPSYARTQHSKVELFMRDGRFVPRILLLRTTQTMTHHNRDKVGHNAKIDFFYNPPMGPALPTGNAIELRYAKEERFPCSLSCAIHPWMRGFVLLRSNPYMAKTDANGRFVIKNLPIGEHVFRLWHERTGYLGDIRIGSLTTDPHGRLTIVVRQGPNALPDAALSPKVFARAEKDNGAE